MGLGRQEEGSHDDINQKIMATHIEFGNEFMTVTDPANNQQPIEVSYGDQSEAFSF